MTKQTWLPPLRKHLAHNAAHATLHPVSAQWVESLLNAYAALPGAIVPAWGDVKLPPFSELDGCHKMAKLRQALAAQQETIPAPWAAWLLAEYDKIATPLHYQAIDAGLVALDDLALTCANGDGDQSDLAANAEVTLLLNTLTAITEGAEDPQGLAAHVMHGCAATLRGRCYAAEAAAAVAQG